jgi:hypothetical protein
METPTKLERFKEASNNGAFTMDEELGMVDHLLTKYNFISKSEYARLNNITPQGVEARLKASNDPYIKMIGKLFIIN